MKKNILICSALAGALALSSASAQDYKGAFREADLGGIKAQGWLKKTLETQRDGFTGNIQVMGGPFIAEGWGPVDGEREMRDWTHYEQVGYWTDGALRAGHLIDDESLLKVPREWIRFQIADADSVGFIGPKHEPNLWPEVIFFRAMMAEYTATKDPKILEAIVKNYKSPKYHDLMATGGHAFGERMVLHIEELCWLYGQTGDRYFLDKAEETYTKFNQKKGDDGISRFTMDVLLDNSYPPSTHSVSYSENMKIPAILYMYTGKKIYLDAAVNAFDKVYKYHGLVDGVPSGNESHDGKHTNNVHESCTITDMQWAIGYLLEATGDVRYADMIERIAFNAAMGAVTKDFKAYQYYSGPNQFVCNENSSQWNSHEWWQNTARTRNAYRIQHGPDCCGGNINRMIPVFASRMWMTKGDDGIAPVLYAPSTFTTRLKGSKNDITIAEETNYPFDDVINFRVTTKKATEFTLWLRIPQWCDDASIKINGSDSGLECKPGTFVQVTRKFKDGDVVQLSLPMKPRVEYAPENGLNILYGPLLFSYSIPSEIKILETKEHNGIEFHTYDMNPAGKWNYAPINMDNIRVVKSGDFSDVWNPEKNPVKLETEVVEIPNWILYRELDTPQMPLFKEKGDTTKLMLVPLGSTTLRVTTFPDFDNTYSKMQ